MASNCHTDCELPRCESCAGCTSDVGPLRERGADLLCAACIDRSVDRTDLGAVAATLDQAHAVRAALGHQGERRTITADDLLALRDLRRDAQERGDLGACVSIDLALTGDVAHLNSRLPEAARLRQRQRYATVLHNARETIEHETDGPVTAFVMIARAIAAARRNRPALAPLPVHGSGTVDPLAEALFAALGLRDDHTPSAYMTADGQG